MPTRYLFNLNEPSWSEQLEALGRPKTFKEQQADMPPALSIAEQVRARRWSRNPITDREEQSLDLEGRHSVVPNQKRSKSQIAEDPYTEPVSRFGHHNDLLKTNKEYSLAKTANSKSDIFSQSDKMISKIKKFQLQKAKKEAISKKYLKTLPVYKSIFNRLNIRAKLAKSGQSIRMSGNEFEWFLKHLVNETNNEAIHGGLLNTIDRVHQFTRFDSNIYGHKSLSSKVIRIEGVGSAEPGHLNYMAVGMLYARYYGLGAFRQIATDVPIWNNIQVFSPLISRSEREEKGRILDWRNLKDIHPGKYWASYGALEYLKRTKYPGAQKYYLPRKYNEK